MFSLTVNNAIAWVTMDKAPVNAIDGNAVDELSDILDNLRRRSDICAVLFTGKGKHFSAGADLKMIDAWEGSTNPTNEMVLFSARLQDAFYRVEELPIPTVAVINGTAAGAGLELALACDVRLLAKSAKVGLPEVRFGWLASAGGSQRLTRQVGRSAAMRIMLFDELIEAEEAHRLGLGEWLVSDDELERATSDIASRLGGLPSPAVRAVKRLVKMDGGANGFAEELSLTRALEAEPEAKQLFRNFLQRKRG